MWRREHTVFAVIAFIAAIMMFIVHWHRAEDVSQAKIEADCGKGRRHVGFHDEHVHGEEAVKTHRLCLSRVRAKSHSSRTTLALSSSRERRSRSSMLSSLSAGTFECGRPQIVFERGRYKIVIEPKLCVSQ